VRHVFTQGLLALSVAAVACNGCHGSERRLRTDDEASREAAHAIEDRRLRTIMDELARLRPDRLPQELDVASERRRRMREIGKAADALAATAGDIPDVLQNVTLSTADRQEFLGLAARLRGQALELDQAAAADDIASVEDLMARIDRTCDDCHGAYRVMPAARP
jgi:cytochrome c556